MTSSLFTSNVGPNKSGVIYRPAGAIFAVEGTIYPAAPNPPSFIAGDNGYWCGFASGVVGGLSDTQDGLWSSPTYPAGWTPNFGGIGYPAKTIPMWPSVQIGRANLNMTLGWYANTYFIQNGSYDGLVILGSAWSQGAMVWMQTFLIDILPSTGTLHYLLPYVYRLYLFGNPMRCPGVAHGNDMAGIPMPPKLDGQVTGGIAGPLDCTEDQASVLAPDGNYLIKDFVNQNDLYADAPCGSDPWHTEPSVEKVEYLFFQIVMQPSFLLILKLATLLGKPVGDIEALVNTGKFFGAGANAGHYQYGPGMTAAVGDALALGNSLPHSGC